MEKIEAPTVCPECSSVLEWVNRLLYCRNPDCSGQQSKKVEHFAKTLKIKGLGPQAIRKIGLTSISELYSLNLESVASALSSQKNAEKILAEVEKSKAATLNELLPAFSIPLIGKTAAEKLSNTCKYILDINEDTCRQAGLGPKATENLMTWLETSFPDYKNLPFSFEFSKKRVAASKGIVCISGKLKSFKTKAEATKALQEAGYEVKGSFTKQVTILVNESGLESSKTKQARDSGVRIVTNLTEIL